MNIGQWLRGLGLQSYEQAFYDHGVDLDVLRRLTADDLKEIGVSVLLVEQNAQAALKIADRAYVMELGEFILDGAASDIANNDRVVASYLGFQHEGTSAI